MNLDIKLFNNYSNWRNNLPEEIKIVRSLPELTCKKRYRCQFCSNMIREVGSVTCKVHGGYYSDHYHPNHCSATSSGCHHFKKSPLSLQEELDLFDREHGISVKYILEGDYNNGTELGAYYCDKCHHDAIFVGNIRGDIVSVNCTYCNGKTWSNINDENTMIGFKLFFGKHILEIIKG